MSFIEMPDKFEVTDTILGVSGSSRINGNSDIILRTLLDGAKSEQIPSQNVNLSSVNFKGCIGCERCRKDKICTGIIDGMSLLYNEILTSKGLVLVSPTHNYNVTSWMKAFIDRFYCFYNFENDRPRSWSSQLAGQKRKAVVAAICEQESKEDMGFTIEAMKKPLEALGYEIVEGLTIFKIFDKGGVKREEETLLQVKALGARLARALKD